MENIAVVGSGWRAEMWTDLLQKMGYSPIVCVRNDFKARLFEEKHNAKIVRSVEQLPNITETAVVAVSKNSLCDVAEQLAALKLKILCETPAGINAEQRERFLSLNGKIGIAEQYPFQPRFVAFNKLVQSGVIGSPHTVSVSCCHGYHAVRLMRILLNTGNEIPSVSVVKIDDTYCEIADRSGEHDEETKPHQRTLALLNFKDKYGIYDFSKAQYFSPIRRGNVVVNGVCGKLDFGGGTYISEGKAFPVDIKTEYGGRGGRLDCLELIRIVAEGKILFENPYRGMRLSEEEIAMAECLHRLLNNENGISAEDAVTDAKIAEALE